MTPESSCRTGQKVKWVFGMLEKCKVLSNHVVFIKLSEVILFPYILGRSQKKFWFLNSRIAGRGVNIFPFGQRVGQDVSDRTLFHLGGPGRGARPGWTVLNRVDTVGPPGRTVKDRGAAGVDLGAPGWKKRAFGCSSYCSWAAWCL